MRWRIGPVEASSAPTSLKKVTSACKLAARQREKPDLLMQEASVSRQLGFDPNNGLFFSYSPHILTLNHTLLLHPRPPTHQLHKYVLVD